MKRLIIPLLLLLAAPPMMGQRTVSQWVTTADSGSLYERREDASFQNERRARQNPIIVDARQSYQEMLGFGFALTGGSAELLMKMPKAERSAILRELFSTEPGCLGISVVRLTVGASDMNSFVFSYDDMPEGKTDYELKHFSLAQDLKDVVPVMQEVVALNPSIWIMASPWSAPAWMKEKYDVRGGKLRRDCYDVYARYFARYVTEMGRQGIHIDALTIQNEPLNSRNTPSMPWSPEDQKLFIRDFLGPEFARQGITTQIIAFDHNCDRPDYPLAIMEDPDAAKYICGTAFHHYGGDLSAMSQVHRFRPDKDIYFTEQMVTNRAGQLAVNMAGQAKRMLIDIPRNWSRDVILWNLAADPNAGPHTDNGGCPSCYGAITIDGKWVGRNIAYYVVAHASEAVPRGSLRISSTAPGDPAAALLEDEQGPGTMRFVNYDRSEVLPNVAFRTPDGRVVLIVSNTTSSRQMFTVQYEGQYCNLVLDSGAVGTYTWAL